MTRTMHRPISVTIGCRASTARGTARSCSASTMAALRAPAAAQASVSRLTSTKPEKRHMPRGMREAAKIRE